MMGPRIIGARSAAPRRGSVPATQEGRFPNRMGGGVGPMGRMSAAYSASGSTGSVARGATGTTGVEDAAGRRAPSGIRGEVAAETCTGAGPAAAA